MDNEISEICHLESPTPLMNKLKDKEMFSSKERKKRGAKPPNHPLAKTSDGSEPPRCPIPPSVDVDRTLDLAMKARA